MKRTTVTFEGIRYLAREVEQDGQILLVAEEALNSVIINEESQYSTPEARYLDEQIIYYVTPQEMELQDEELKKVIF